MARDDIVISAYEDEGEGRRVLVEHNDGAGGSITIFDLSAVDARLLGYRLQGGAEEAFTLMRKT